MPLQPHEGDEPHRLAAADSRLRAALLQPSHGALIAAIRDFTDAAKLAGMPVERVIIAVKVAIASTLPVHSAALARQRGLRDAEQVVEVAVRHCIDCYYE